MYVYSKLALENTVCISFDEICRNIVYPVRSGSALIFTLMNISPLSELSGETGSCARRKQMKISWIKYNGALNRAILDLIKLFPFWKIRMCYLVCLAVLPPVPMASLILCLDLSFIICDFLFPVWYFYFLPVLTFKFSTSNCLLF